VFLLIVSGEQIANDIRHLIRDYKKMIPTLLEIPSKEKVDRGFFFLIIFHDHGLRL
jgi:vacuolar-type H+-ATPase subunit F/Vma7